jgi:hypothetical protein
MKTAAVMPPSFFCTSSVVIAVSAKKAQVYSVS